MGRRRNKQKALASAIGVMCAVATAAGALLGATDKPATREAMCVDVRVCIANGSGTQIIGPTPDGSIPSSATIPDAPITSPSTAILSPTEVTARRLERYCAQWRMTAVLRSADAYGWRCTRAGAQDINVSMTQLCAEQFGPQWLDRFTDFGDPDSWECYTI